MKVIQVTKEMDTLPLGRLGENKRTKFVFDVSDWLEEYPGASIGLMARRPHVNSSYPVILSDEGDGKYGWTVTSGDLSTAGEGKCQLKAIENSVVVKSRRYNTHIEDALDGQDDPPEEWESWLDAIQRAAEIAIIKDGKLRFAINDAGHLIMSYTEDVPIDGEGDSTTTEDDVTWVHKDLGPVEAYAQAVAGGYTGTKAEWIAEIANASTNAQLAEDYKEAAEQAKDDAQAAAATASAAYDTDLLAPVFSGYMSYKKGDFVIYDGGLYRAKETHSAAAWNADNWESVTFNTVVRALQEKADNLLTEVGDDVIDFIEGKYISTSITHAVGDTLDLTPTSYYRYSYAIREVSPGDVVTIKKAETYSESSPYIFIDANNKILAIGASGTVTDVTLTAPENTAKLVINSLRTRLGMCYIGKLIKDRKADKDNTELNGGLTLGKGTADETTITAAQLAQLLALIQ